MNTLMRIGLIVLPVLISSIGLPAAAQEQPRSIFEVKFSRSQSVDDVIQAALQRGLEVLSLRDTFTVGGVLTTDFFFVQPDNQSSASIVESYRRARQGMLADMANDLKKMGANSSPMSAPRGRSVSDTLASPDANAIDVEGTELRGDTLQARQLARDLRGTIERVGRNSEIPAGSVSAAAVAQGPQTLAAPTVSTWAPKQGWLYTGISSTAGQRYATNYMWWNNVTGLRQNSLTTYEHDLVLNNYDGKTYFDQSENSYKQPRVTYASSNLPSPYLDTRAFDSRSELSYTIGSGAGSSIQANTSYWYNTYFQILPGNTNTDFAKINGQLGRKDPSCIILPFAFCVFPVATTPLAPAWTLPVPSTKSWIRN